MTNELFTHLKLAASALEIATTAKHEVKEHLKKLRSEMDGLLATLDLTDAGQLTRLAQLHTVTSLGTEVIKVGEAARSQVEKDLSMAVKSFRESGLKPRLIDLHTKLLTKLRGEMTGKFHDVESAIADSKPMVTLAALRPLTSDRQVPARMLIEAWETMDAIELEHLQAV